MKLRFTSAPIALIAIILIVSLDNAFTQDSLSWVNINGSPLTINALTQMSFTFYLDLKILKTDKIKIAFPGQIILTDGPKNCLAVLFF
jgi:hypothetical protein